MGAIWRSPNYAQEDDCVRIVREQWIPLVNRVRKERQLLTTQWLRYDNLLKCRHDSDSYHGRSRAYLATARRVIENWVTKLKNDSFPDSMTWWSTKAEVNECEDLVPTVDALFRKYIMQYMKLRRKSGPILRQLVTLGTSPIDMGWLYRSRAIPTLQRLARGGSGTEETIKQIVEYIGPTIRPVDLFRWYAYPATANDVEDLSTMFEDCLLAGHDIERLGKTPIGDEDDDLGMQFEHTQDALELMSTNRETLGKYEAERSRMAARGLHSPVDTKEDTAHLLSTVKGYWQTDQLPIDEDPDAMGAAPWYQIAYAGEDVVMQIRRVVFWKGKPSYLVPKFAEVINEFYGYGLPSVFDSLHYMMNDILNQGGDALTFSLNPIVGIDPGAVQDPTSIRMRPGAKWLVRKPRENMTFTEPPKESAMVAMQAVQNMISLINDVANVAPFSGTSSGQSRGRAVDTASGMQMVASENLVQVHDVIQNLEDQWFDPMLFRMYDMTMQCLDMPVLLNVEGVKGAALIQREITRDDVIGDFSFHWQASISNFNLQVRAQQMTAFLQIVSRIPPQVWEQENKRISIPYICEQLWSHGFALPDVDRLLIEIHPVRSMDADLENQVFLAGRGDGVHVSPADKDQDHLKKHDMLLGSKTLKPEDAQLLMTHMVEHVNAMQAKMMMQAMQQLQQQGGMPMGGPPGQMGGQGQAQIGMAPGGPGNASGSGALAGPTAPGRIAQTTDMGDVMRTMGRGPGGLQ